MNTIPYFRRATGNNFLSAPRPVDWIWEGYLARGATTLLTSQWKAGKTTLVSVLLNHLATGQFLAGLRVKPTKAVIVSEERVEHWHRRSQTLRFADNMIFYCRDRPFPADPEAWRNLLTHLEQLGRDERVELVIIDPLAPFLPGGAENGAAAIRAAVEPLEPLKALRQSVLLLHHPCKGKTAPGQAARGSGALSAYVDVLIEMQLPHGDGPLARRRRLRSWSRLHGTPRNRVIELSLDGTTYTDVPLDPAAYEFKLAPVVTELLRAAPAYTLSRQEILRCWPPTLKLPHASALWRALAEGVKSGHLIQQGSGRRNAPLRYQLPASERNDEDDPADQPSPIAADSP
jgi:hypothetical protein